MRAGCEVERGREDGQEAGGEDRRTGGGEEEEQQYGVRCRV